MWAGDPWIGAGSHDDVGSGWRRVVGAVAFARFRFIGAESSDRTDSDPGKDSALRPGVAVWQGCRAARRCGLRFVVCRGRSDSGQRKARGGGKGGHRKKRDVVAGELPTVMDPGRRVDECRGRFRIYLGTLRRAKQRCQWQSRNSERPVFYALGKAGEWKLESGTRSERK